MRWMLAVTVLIGIGCSGDSKNSSPTIPDATTDVVEDATPPDVVADTPVNDVTDTPTPDTTPDAMPDATIDIPPDVSPSDIPLVPSRREGLFANFRFVNAAGDMASTKFTNYVHPVEWHKLGDQTRATLAPGHSVDETYEADGVSWYLAADVSFAGEHWPLEPRNELFHLKNESTHMDSASSDENGYTVEERSQTFTNGNLAGLAEVFRYTDGNNNYSLVSPNELPTNDPPTGGVPTSLLPDGDALGYGYPRYGKVDATNIESLLVTATHEIGSSGRFVSMSSNPIGGGAVWDIVYTDAAEEKTGFVNHLDFGRGVQTTLVYLFDEDDQYNNFERTWLATEGGGQMWTSVGKFAMKIGNGCGGNSLNTIQECFDNVFGSPCLQIKNEGLTQVTQAIPMEYFPWMHEFTPPTKPKRIRSGHWPTYPVDGKTTMSQVPNGGGAGETQEPIAYGLNPPYAVTWNAAFQGSDAPLETPRGLIIFPDDRIGKTADFSLFKQGRPIIQYTVRITTTATNQPATMSLPAMFLKGSLRHSVEFYDPHDSDNNQVLSSPDKLGSGRFQARQPTFGGNPDVTSTNMSYILSEDVTPTSPAIGFYAVGEEAGGPLQSVSIAFKSDSDPAGVVRSDPFNTNHMHVQPSASHIAYSSGTKQNGGNLNPGTYEWTTFIIVDELQNIKGHIDWLYQNGTTGGGYQYTPK